MCSARATTLISPPSVSERRTSTSKSCTDNCESRDNWRLSTAGKVVDTSSHKRHTRCWWSSSQTAESSVTVPPLSLSIRGDKHIFCHRSTFFVDTSNVSVEVTA